MELRQRDEVVSTLKTILIVDDSKFMRLANERALTKAGFRVLTAGDGEEALHLASSHNPDLIILDMLLPKLAGLDVLKSLRRNPTTAFVPVIVLSSLTQKNEDKLLKEGATAYYEKSRLSLDRNCDAFLKIVQELTGGTEPGSQPYKIETESA